MAGNAAVSALVRQIQGNPPTVQRATLDYGNELVDNKPGGGYLWKIDWLLTDKTGTAAGYIVQHVQYQERRCRCDENFTASTPVSRAGDYYEAWPVQAGVIGGVKEDTWINEPISNGRVIDITLGSAKFLERETAPDSWPLGAVPEAADLRSSRTPPDNWHEDGTIERKVKVAGAKCPGNNSTRLFINDTEVNL